MSSTEKAPTHSEGLFTHNDLYWRAVSALLAKSTARVLALNDAKQRQQPPNGFLAHGSNRIAGALPLITVEDLWDRPLRTVQDGYFEISDDHYIGLGDCHPYGRSPSPEERQASLAAGIAPIHISISKLDFVRHYDLFYPEHLTPGERLHTTIYPVDPTEQQYQLPHDWPEDQPYLEAVSLGSAGGPIVDPSQHSNLARVYNALGSITTL
ncbi:MAG TPA: hypothetical protein VJ843_01085 [Candidatus Saccharimonadales bacterium]|nr:hypothetical protein [Candidatus Saccharimonadales bacterium]